MASFTSNTPQSSEFPSTSQPLMLANNQYLAVFGAKDHKFTTNSTDADCGTHKQVTLTNQSGSPGIPTGTNCVFYSKSVTNAAGNPESELFFDNGAAYQLTSHTPVKAASGYSSLPGGLMIIWGTNTINQLSTVNFPNDPATGLSLRLSASTYMVCCNLVGVNSLGFATIESYTSTGFSVRVRGPDGNPNVSAVVNWIAIGPA